MSSIKGHSSRRRAGLEGWESERAEQPPDLPAGRDLSEGPVKREMTPFALNPLLTAERDRQGVWLSLATKLILLNLT